MRIAIISIGSPGIFHRCILFMKSGLSPHIQFIAIFCFWLTACQGTATYQTETPVANPPIATASSSTPDHIIATIPLDWKPTLIAQGDGLLWIVGRDDHLIARLDPQTNQFIGKATTLPEPIYDIVVGEGGVWVTGDTLVTRLDSSTGNITATLRADQFGDGSPFRLTLGDGWIWLLNLLGDAPSSIHKIDPRTNQFVGEAATVGVEAVGITFGAGSIWTADHDSATVSRVDPKTNGLVATIRLSFEPHYIFFNPDDGLLWVANYHANSVTRIDPHTNQLTGELLPVPFAPEWMTSGTGKVWVIPSPYAENNVLQNFQGIAEFDVANAGYPKIVSVSGRPMDAVLSAGSLWVTTQDPNQILRLNLE